nr:formylglycine-generating enzyme family protein [uncultured Desulfobacter sp.]
MQSEPPAPVIRTTRNGRADLIRLLNAGGGIGLDENAPLFGFVRKKKQPEQKNPPAVQTIAGTPGPPPRQVHLFIESRGDMRFSCLTAFENKDPGDIRVQVPEWAQYGNTLTQVDSRAKQTFKPPVYLPLEKTSRIWPFIKAVLGTLAATVDPDMEKAVPLAASLSPMDRLPMATRLTWHAGACVILDFHDKLMPFWQDIRQIARLIIGVRGESGLGIRVLEKGPQQGFRKLGDNDFKLYPFRPPVAGTPVLILSDLGCFSVSRERLNAWLRFGRACRTKCIKPVVLTPCPSYLWDNGLSSFFTMVWWDRGQKIPRPDSRNQIASVQRAGPIKNAKTKVEHLLSLLSCAVRVEPGLLRAVRFALPQAAADSGIEAMAWNHSHMKQSPVAAFFDNKTVADDYKARLARLAAHEKNRPLVSKIVSIRDLWHNMLAPAVLWEEEMEVAALCKRKAAPRLNEFFETFFRTVSVGLGTEDMTAWFNRMSDRLTETAWAAHSRVLTPSFVLVNRKAWEQGTVRLPRGADLAHAAWLTAKTGSVKTITVYQVGRQLAFLPQQGPTGRPDHNGFSLGSPIVSFETSGDYSINGAKASAQEDFWMELPEKESVRIDTDRITAFIDGIFKPAVAGAVGRDNSGLFIRFPKSDQKIYHPWGNPGEDQWGIYTDYQVKGVTFRMRWIRPGTFMMGSPDDEPERRDNEIHHEVTLTRGFWLADTACTQALWQAVMEYNRSAFKGDDRPVDNVSWEDCRAFLERINGLVPGFNFGLPSEAQWEYACRADTLTPFSFGRTILTDQANFHVNYPYAGVKKGESRETTVLVKALPCNNWGLYQMHGNVWEWCRDWYGDYDLEGLVDPQGPDTGGDRVLRGGSWDYFAGSLRSAFRSRRRPSSRSSFIGFRLAQGHL